MSNILSKVDQVDVDKEEKEVSSLEKQLIRLISELKKAGVFK